MLLCTFQCIPLCSFSPMVVLSDGVGNGDTSPALTMGASSDVMITDEEDGAEEGGAEVEEEDVEKTDKVDVVEDAEEAEASEAKLELEPEEDVLLLLDCAARRPRYSTVAKGPSEWRWVAPCRTTLVGSTPSSAPGVPPPNPVRNPRRRQPVS